MASGLMPLGAERNWLRPQDDDDEEEEEEQQEQEYIGVPVVIVVIEAFQGSAGYWRTFAGSLQGALQGALRGASRAVWEADSLEQELATLQEQQVAEPEAWSPLA